MSTNHHYMAAPSAPRNVKVVNPENKTLTVMWDTPEDINGVIAGYTIVWMPPDNGESMTLADGNQATLSVLQSCTEYIATVAYTTGGGDGNPPTEALEETESKLHRYQHVYYDDYYN